MGSSLFRRGLLEAGVVAALLCQHVALAQPVNKRPATSAADGDRAGARAPAARPATPAWQPKVPDFSLIAADEAEIERLRKLVEASPDERTFVECTERMRQIYSHGEQLAHEGHTAEWARLLQAVQLLQRDVLVARTRAAQPANTERLKQDTQRGMAEIQRRMPKLPSKAAISLTGRVAVDRLFGGAKAVFDDSRVDWAAPGEAKARPLETRTLDFWERALRGPSEADVKSQLFDYALANPADDRLVTDYRDAIAAIDKDPAAVQTTIDLAALLCGLADVYQLRGAYGEAEPLLRRALALAEKQHGVSAIEIAPSLDRLAQLHHQAGAFAEAEAVLLRALAIRERARGKFHPEVAMNVASLGLLARDRGDLGKAEQLMTRACDATEKTLGPSHPRFASCLNSLAEVYLAQGAYAKAAQALARAAELREAGLDLDLARAPDQARRMALMLLHAEADAIISVHTDVAAGQGPELALTTTLRRKGRSLGLLASAREAMLADLTPRVQERLNALSAARAELVDLTYGDSVRACVRLFQRAMEQHGRLSEHSKEAAKAEGCNLTDFASARNPAFREVHLLAQIRELESSLFSAISVDRVARPVTIAAVQAKVPADAALIEFARYRRFDARQARTPWQAERYVAFIVTSHGSPQTVSLGDANELDRRIDAVQAVMDRANHASVEQARRALRELDALVGEPIRARLAKDVTHLILAPDGKLNMVPFEALVDAEGHYALEDRLITYVTTGRDLLRPATPTRSNAPATLIAYPDYGAPSAHSLFPPFKTLPGTEREKEYLQPYFATSALTGRAATKAALKALIGPPVLHIATHGFWERDFSRGAPSAASGSAEPDGVAAPERLTVVAGAAPPRNTHDLDPMSAQLASGLALAGANEGPTGILTAEEMAGLDWRGTKLVVLSACNTAQGNTPSGDGVYGMRHALVLAGAETQVITLWNVNDQSGPELMRLFYRALANGTERGEALRQAKRDLSRDPRYAHPYFWAPFVLAGAWGPLGSGVLAHGGAP